MALAALVSGCGVLPGDGSGSAPLTVMTWAPQGAGSTTMPGMPAMALAYARWVNAHGGLSGHPLRVLTCDEHDDQVAATTCARRAVQAHAIAVVGSYSQYARQFMAPLELANIPYLGGYGASADEFGSPLSYPVNGGAATALAGDGIQLSAACRRVAVVRPDSIQGDLVPQFLDAGLRAGHQGAARDVLAPTDATSYTAQARQALSAAQAGPGGGAGGCVAAALGESTSTFLDSYQRLTGRQGTPVRLSSVLGSVGQSLVDRTGGASGPLEGALVTGWYPPADDPRWAPLRRVVHDYAFDDDRIDPGDSGVQTTWIAYTVLRAVVARIAARGTGPITALTLRRELDSDSAPISTGGLTPRLRWRRQDMLGVPGYPRVVNGTVTFQEVRNGRLVSAHRASADVTAPLEDVRPGA